MITYYARKLPIKSLLGEGYKLLSTVIGYEVRVIGHIQDMMPLIGTKTVAEVNIQGDSSSLTNIIFSPLGFETVCNMLRRAMLEAQETSPESRITGLLTGPGTDAIVYEVVKVMGDIAEE
jgi:hypothetical protein